MNISTLVFDLGDVMVWTRWERLTGLFADMTGLAPEQVLERMRRGDAYYPFCLGRFGEEEFYRRLTRQFGLDIEPQRMFEIWDSVIEPNEAISDLIDRLIGHYRLVIGSNTDVLHFARGLEVQPVLTHFDDAILSYEIGRAKPDPEFFTLGLEKLSLSARGCVFIDDREENVETARTLGMAGIRFLSVYQLESDLTALGLL